MVKLLYDLHVPHPDLPEGVLEWAKSPEQTLEDLRQGVARIGGYRTPSYAQAYLLGAKTLFHTATIEQTLDHQGLPIFYLLRHATELLIKEALFFGVEIQRYRLRLNKPAAQASRLPSDPRATEGHDFADLMKELRKLAKELELGDVPGPLEAVVSQIRDIEQKRHTWSRYGFSWTKDGIRKPHMDVEVTLPLGKMLAELSAASNELGATWAFGDNFMGRLVEQWHDLAKEAGDA